MKNLECVSVAGVNGTPSQFIFCSGKQLYVWSVDGHFEGSLSLSIIAVIIVK